jgi:hypothetical protein
MSNPVDDKGNVRVDFAWGNMPLQPNDKRVAGSGGSYGAYGSTEDADSDLDAEYARAGIAIPSNILDVKLDDHVRATGDFELGLRPGWNGFPGYEPNTTGDGDYEVFIDTDAGSGALILLPSRDFSFAALRDNSYFTIADRGKLYIEGTFLNSAADAVLRSRSWAMKLTAPNGTTAGVYPVSAYSGGHLSPTDDTWTAVLANLAIAGAGYAQSDFVASEISVDPIAGTLEVKLIVSSFAYIAGTDFSSSTILRGAQTPSTAGQIEFPTFTADLSQKLRSRPDWQVVVSRLSGTSAGNYGVNSASFPQTGLIDGVLTAGGFFGPAGPGESLLPDESYFVAEITVENNSNRLLVRLTTG